MKKCPYCAEEIQDEAIKCKHCGEWLQKEGTPKAQTDSYDVILQDPGTNKIATIKKIRELYPLSLAKAKALADNPSVIESGISASEAEDIRNQFQRLGARVDIIPLGSSPEIVSRTPDINQPTGAESAGNSLNKVGQNLSGIGCWLIMLITIPAIIVILWIIFNSINP